MLKLHLDILLIIVLLSACNLQKQEITKANNEMSFEWEEDIKIPIDNETFFAPHIHGYSPEIKKIYIYNIYI
jgi:hypothetical protein